ncbi:MAG: GYD domain-containing protein [Acidimicrobiia bacterium]
MAKYLLDVKYTLDGLKGMVSEGGTARKEAAIKAVESVGGTMEAFYFAFGETDVYAIADVPDNVTAAAVALKLGATGAVAIRTVVLLTPAEVDAAAKVDIAYRPPGT